jgi:hypothetical protein
MSSKSEVHPWALDPDSNAGGFNLPLVACCMHARYLGKVDTVRCTVGSSKLHPDIQACSELTQLISTKQKVPYV